MLGLSFVVCLTNDIAAQTLIQEDFETGVWPPPGWQEIVAVGSSANWELDDVTSNGYGVGTYSAFHDDGIEGYPNDSFLVLPAIDTVGMTELWLHYTQYVRFAAFRQRHSIWVTTGDPLNPNSYELVYEDRAPGDRLWRTDVNLCNYVNLEQVYVAFRYEGDFASEWHVDDVLINDIGPSDRPPYWSQLPTQFLQVNALTGYAEDFEALAGTVPPYMAVNELNPVSSLPDPEAWCNLGQKAPCLNPYAGSFALEMGLDPSSTNYHDVRNGLVIALDASGVVGPLMLDFQVYNARDEIHPDDGIWVSADGQQWEQVFENWSQFPVDTWYAVTGLDLSQSTVNTCGKFYLLFAQEDDYPYLGLDGIGLDNLFIYGSGIATEPCLQVVNATHGEFARVTLSNLQAGEWVRLLYSRTGPGPTILPSGCGNLTLALSLPIQGFGLDQATGSTWMRRFKVPNSLCGKSIFLHAVVAAGGTCRLSNPLEVIIQ